MSVTIQSIAPQSATPLGTTPLGTTPVHCGVTISGVTSEAAQNVHVYYEIPQNGVQSANLRAVSDDHGCWSVSFPGDFKVGTEVTAYARNGSAELAWLTRSF